MAETLIKIERDRVADDGSAISLADLATVLGISLRTAQRFTQMGDFRPIGYIGNNKKLYSLKDCVQLYLGSVKEKLTADSQESRIDALKAEKLQAEIDLKQSQGELHQIKTLLAKGDYIHVEDVKADYERFFVAFKKFAMAFPGRLSGIIAGYVDPAIARGIERDLQIEVNQMLRTFVAAGNQPPDGVL